MEGSPLQGLEIAAVDIHPLRGAPHHRVREPGGALAVPAIQYYGLLPRQRRDPGGAAPVVVRRGIPPPSLDERFR